MSTFKLLREAYDVEYEVRVIEKSAYDALLTQAMALREALFCCSGLNDDYRAKSADKALAAFDRFLAGDEK